MTIGVAFFGGATGSVTGAVTLNPSDKHANIALSSANLIATKTGSDAGPVSVRATRGIAHTDSGYFEVFLGQGQISTFMTIGLSTTSLPVANFCGFDANSWAYYQDTGGKYANNVLTAYGNTWKVNGDVIGVAFKNGKLWFAKNNVWQNSGDPAAGTGEAFNGITGTLYPTLSLYRATAPSHQLGFRPSAASFAYGPPTGFLAWEY